jgi:hypothetical protein
MPSLALAGTSGTGFLVTGACAPARFVRRRVGSWLVGPDHSASLVFSRCRHRSTFEALPLAAFLQVRGVTWGSTPRVLRLAFEDALRHSRLVMPVRLTRADRSRPTPCARCQSAVLPAEAVRCVLPAGLVFLPTEAIQFTQLAMRASSHGVLKEHPSIDMHSRCPLPHAASSLFRSRSCQILNMFRPCRFSRLRRFSPSGWSGLVASRCQSWDSSGFRLCPRRGLVETPKCLSLPMRRTPPSWSRACDGPCSASSP